MRLLVNSLAMQSPGALELQQELIGALVRTAPADASLVAAVQTGRLLRCADQLDVRYIPPHPLGWIGRWQWIQRGLPQLIRDEKADVLFEMSGHLSGAIVRSCGVVTTANNMLPFTSELLADQPVITRFKLGLLRRIFLHGLRVADTVVLHSEHARDLMTRDEPALRAKIAVALTGVPPSMWRDATAPLPRHPLDGRPYFFYLSTMYRYKNHLRLVAAYKEALRLASSPLPDLILAGIPGDPAYVAELVETIQGMGLADRVRYLGGVERASLPGWMYHAHANLFASLCETNSVVQSEILGMGGIMACSSIPPMNEVPGTAALLFDPRSEASMRDALLRLAAEPALRDELRAASMVRREDLSWDACGRLIWAQAAAARLRFGARTSHG